MTLEQGPALPKVESMLGAETQRIVADFLNPDGTVDLDGL